MKLSPDLGASAKDHVKEGAFVSYTLYCNLICTVSPRSGDTAIEAEPIVVVLYLFKYLISSIRYLISNNRLLAASCKTYSNDVSMNGAAIGFRPSGTA